MTIRNVFLLTSLVLLALLPSCAGRSLHSEQERNMTVGVVQKEVRIGMASPEVVAALGSPNMVRKNADTAGETWVYDKIATEASYKNSNTNVGGSASGAGIAGDVLLLGNVGASRGGSKGSSATTQKTLTVIIRFDANDKVESFSYHTSTF
ncbi:MAG: hypothetical protein FJY92_04490 [Candidatus Hydrogenedentes bacterium]|nr:hypothetical protein [Candidatus Hydrogenedentota bacterium]